MIVDRIRGVPANVFRPEYLIAIAASVGRHKDLAASNN
jgi:hypothetical protein